MDATKLVLRPGFMNVSINFDPRVGATEDILDHHHRTNARSIRLAVENSMEFFASQFLFIVVVICELELRHERNIVTCGSL